MEATSANAYKKTNKHKIIKSHPIHKEKNKMLTVSCLKRRTRKQMLINSYPYLVLFTFVACLLYHALFSPLVSQRSCPQRE